jgi:hypothetical protein
MYVYGNNDTMNALRVAFVAQSMRARTKIKITESMWASYGESNTLISVAHLRPVKTDISFRTYVNVPHGHT